MRTLASNLGLPLFFVAFWGCSGEMGNGGGPSAGAGSSAGGSPAPNAGGMPSTREDAASSGGGPEASAGGGAGRPAGAGGTTDAAPPRRDASTQRDASVVEGGGGGIALGDAGTRPFKGVANSGCADLVTLGASWYYNWTLSPGNCRASQFVPMIWGHTGNEQTAAGITSEINGLVRAGYQSVLGFNEPDNGGQSNIPVASAISLWPSFSESSLRIGSPATQANTTGLAWFSNGAQTFMAEVNADTTGRLRTDFISMHWYGWNEGSCEPNATTFEAYIRQIEMVPGNRPIWITEFGCLNLSAPTTAVVQTFFAGALAMLAKHPRIERYAWYPWATNHALVDANGALTPLGAIFAAAPAYK